MVEHINAQRKANESIGGVFEVVAFGLIPGLGSYASWETRLDGRIARAICSIQAVKGVTLGEAFEIAAKPGSEAHDEIFFEEGRGYYRETNRSGGLEGGMTTGEPLIVRGAMKPLPTLTQPLRSVDIATREPAQALRERTDSSTVPAAGVVAEAMLAFVLAEAYREKFGGDHLEDAREARCALRRADRVDAPLTRSLAFAGFMGAGKSTLARDAARQLGVALRDTDALLVEALGEPIADFWEREGEAAFRAREEALVLDVLAGPPGGDRARRRRARVGARARGARRTTSSCTSRSSPSWPGREPPGAAAGRWPPSAARFEALYAERLPVYREAATATLPTSEVVALRARAAGAAGARRRPRRRAASCCGRRAPRATTRSGSARARSSALRGRSMARRAGWG